MKSEFTFTSKALQSVTENSQRAEKMIKDLEQSPVQKFIGRKADDAWHLVGKRDNGELGLFFTNNPVLFDNPMQIERLVCNAPIEAIDALTWYKGFYQDCLDSIRIFSTPNDLEHPGTMGCEDSAPR